MSAPPIKIPGVRFEHLIGIGGMSEVWLGFHGGLNKEVAIKVMFKEAATSGEEIRQFMQESRVMESINHPGIVHSYEADCRDGRYYFIMDYVDGFTFALILTRQEQITETDAVVILDSVAEALDYAWQSHGVIHCDIKPDNIMVGSDGIVKILDLGLCNIMGVSSRGRTESQEDVKETITGTPAYMSPEQIYGDRDIDVRSDIYCLGATLYHLVTGRVLFPDLSNDETLRSHVTPEVSAPDPRSLNPDLSEGLVRILSKMCAKDVGDRYEDWKKVLADSEIMQSGGLPEPLPEGVPSSIKANR
jgi:serine/threonine-protein kinase